MSNTEQKSRRTGCWLLSFVGLGFLLIAVWLGLKGWRVYQAATSLQARQAEVETLLAQGLMNVDLDSAETLVRGVRHDVAVIKAETALFMPLTPYLGWIPKYGPLIEDAPNWLEIADASTQTLVELFDAVKPALMVMQANGGPGNLSALVATLTDAQPTLAANETNLERIVKAFGEIDSWAALPAQFERFQEPVNELLALAPDALALTEHLPTLLGMDTPQTYLLMVQNDDELRPTGGFISGVALLEIADGDVRSLEFIDSYAVDDLANKPYELAPEPLARFMNVQLLLMRDANFWPDFPTSAEKVADLFRYGQDDAPQIDGVIAIDQQFLSMLLEATGPVAVPDLDLQVDSNNVIQQMRETYNTDDDQTIDGEWWTDRKSFMEPIAIAIQNRLLDEPESVDLPVLLKNVLDAGRQKHLQIYSTDEAIAAGLKNLGLDGSLPVGDSADILLVQDMNMGYNKVSAVMQRELSYTVDLTDAAAPLADLVATYTHTGNGARETCLQFAPYDEQNQYQGLIDNCYWNYLRVYAPTGSTLVSATSHPVPAEWLVTGEAWTGEAGVISDPSGLSVFDNFMVIEQNDSVSSAYQYQLPDNVVEALSDGSQVYQLTIVKPAATAAERVQVQVVLPDGAEVIEAAPDGVIDSESGVLFDFLLSADTTLTVHFR